MQLCPANIILCDDICEICFIFAKIIKDENQDEHFEHQDNYHHFDDPIPPEEEDLEDKPLKPKKPKLAKPFKCQECDYRATKVRNIKVSIALKSVTLSILL